jgi:hypothetical protein
MLSETQRDAKFFVAQIRTVGREVAGEITLVMAGAPTDGTFEQPFADTIFRTTTILADFAQQWRHMNGIAKPPGQGRCA